MVDAIESAVATPKYKIVMYRALWRKVLGQGGAASEAPVQTPGRPIKTALTGLYRQTRCGCVRYRLRAIDSGPLLYWRSAGLAAPGPRSAFHASTARSHSAQGIRARPP